MAYLIRTFRFNKPDGSNYNKGDHITTPSDDVYSTDTGIVIPQSGRPNINDAGYNAHAAVGFADPLFSLFPVSSDTWQDKNADDTAKRLIETFGDYYDALPELLKRGSLKDAINYGNDLIRQAGDIYNLGEDDWGSFAVAELKKDFPLHEKNKYWRLLNNLRGYGPHLIPPITDEDKKEYDRPQHALIEANIDNIQKAQDKLYKNSAESDGPNEFRVNDYTIKGLYTPRQVDAIIKKYYPDYIPGHTRDLVKDDSRAKDALDEIISIDSDDILSDERVKNVIKGVNNALNSKYVGNIANVIMNRWY